MRTRERRDPQDYLPTYICIYILKYVLRTYLGGIVVLTIILYLDM